MTNECDRYLEKTLDITDEMIRLADQAEAACSDNRCAVVYGILRDSAYRVRNEAQRERENHLTKAVPDFKDDKKENKNG